MWQTEALSSVAGALHRREADPSIPSGPLLPRESAGRRRPLAPLAVQQGSPAAKAAAGAHPGMSVHVPVHLAVAMEEHLDEPRAAAGSLVGGNELLLSLVNPVVLGGQLILEYEPGDDAEAARTRIETVGREVFARACSWALDEHLHRDSPLTAALATGKPVLAHIFAGRSRGDAGLDAKVEAQADVAVAAYDTKRDTVHGDLRRPEAKRALRAAARVRWVTRGFSGCPCESMTVMRFNPPRPGMGECPPLRLRSWLPDWPPIPEGWEDYFEMHEEFVELTFDLGDDILAWPGGRFAVEGPIDRGDKAGRPLYYRAKWKEHVPLEKHPRAVVFIKKHKAGVVDFCQCMSNGPFQKATSLISDPETSAAFEGAACIPCVHEGKHKEQAYGDDEDGESKSARSAEYPEGMCGWLAVGLCGGSREEVYAAALEAAQPVLREVGADVAARFGVPLWGDGEGGATGGPAADETVETEEGAGAAATATADERSPALAREPFGDG